VIDQELVSVAMAAALCGVSVKSIERAIRTGAIHPIKMGKRTLIPASELSRVTRYGVPAMPQEIMK